MTTSLEKSTSVSILVENRERKPELKTAIGTENDTYVRHISTTRSGSRPIITRSKEPSRF